MSLIPKLKKGDIIAEEDRRGDEFRDKYEVLEDATHIVSSFKTGWEVKLKKLKDGSLDSFFVSDDHSHYGPEIMVFK